jgi:hypothetical protein
VYPRCGFVQMLRQSHLYLRGRAALSLPALPALMKMSAPAGRGKNWSAAPAYMPHYTVALPASTSLPATAAATFAGVGSSHQIMCINPSNPPLISPSSISAHPTAQLRCVMKTGMANTPVPARNHHRQHIEVNQIACQSRVRRSKSLLQMALR